MKLASTKPDASASAEPEAGGVQPSGVRFARLRRPLPLTLLLALLLALALQLWRPYFHLTDDNLTATYPISREIVHRVAAGQPAGIVESIFGGAYPWTHDASAITNLCGPYQLLCSWLLLTPAEFIYIDAVSTLILMTIAGAFAWSALALRQRLELKISDGWIVFLSLSYAFSPFNLMVGPAWLGFLNAQAAAPVILVAMLSSQWRRSIPLVAGSLLFSIFGGHLHSACFLGLFMGLLALGLAWTEKSFRPPLILAGGAITAFLVALPLLIPALQGFGHSSRSAAWSLEYSMFMNIPASTLIPSFFSGPLGSFVWSLTHPGDSGPGFHPIVAFSLASLLLVAVLCVKRRWTRLDFVSVGGILVAMVFIVRPLWLAIPFHHLPVFSSLRWPFREVSLLLFFSHIFLLLNLPLLTPKVSKAAVLVGVLFCSATLLEQPPSINPMWLDRALILEGIPQDFWARYIRERGAAPIIVSSIGNAEIYKQDKAIPYALLGGFNYACLLGVTNVSGYSPTAAPQTRFSDSAKPWHHGGLFSWPDAERLRAAHPEVVHVSIRQIKPTVFTIQEGTSVRAFALDPQTLAVKEIARPAKPAGTSTSTNPSASEPN